MAPNPEEPYVDETSSGQVVSCGRCRQAIELPIDWRTPTATCPYCSAMIGIPSFVLKKIAALANERKQAQAERKRAEAERERAEKEGLKQERKDRQKQERKERERQDQEREEQERQRKEREKRARKEWEQGGRARWQRAERERIRRTERRQPAEQEKVPPKGENQLSCPKCSGVAVGESRGCLIVLAILLFPIGLLLLLLPQTFTCSECGYKFRP